jgi:ligand-binding sensor domain-containing protein
LGRIWLGHATGGLSRFDGGHFRTYAADDSRAGSPASSLAEHDDGSIWVGTEGAGLFRLHPDSANGVEPIPLEDGPPEILALHRGDSRTWVGTSDGLFATGTGSDDVRVRRPESTALEGRSVTALWEGPRGRLWIGTAAAGLYLLDPGRNPVAVAGLPRAPIRDLLGDGAGHLWMATKGGGLSRLDPATGTIDSIARTDGLPTEELLSITGGEGDELWIGTYGHGLVRYLPSTDRFEYYSLADSGVDVYTVFRDRDGTIWAGATDVGLVELIREPGESLRFEVHGRDQGLKHLAIDSIAQDLDGVLWISADDGGLYTFDGAHFTDIGTGSALGGEHVYLVACDKFNDILAGTNYGLYKYDRQTGNFSYLGRDQGFWGIEANVNAAYAGRSAKIPRRTGGTRSHRRSSCRNSRSFSNRFPWWTGPPSGIGATT